MRVVLRGRSAEMTAALGPLRRAVRAGQGGVLLVTGEPGIGKSALLATVAAEASGLGFRVGAAAGGEDGPAPLLSALRSGPDPLLTAAELTELTGLAPVLLVDRVAGRLAELAGTAGAGAPLLIVVDDLQGVSREGRVTLRALTARLTGVPVVWALGSRRASREFLAGLEEAGPHGVRVEWVRLGPLPRPEVAALARDRLGHEPDDALRRMLAGSGGNPRLAVAVIDGLAQAAARGEPTDRIPSVLVRTVRRVLTRLGPGPRELAELAAVLDRPMTVSQACALLPGQNEAEVAAGIDQAIAAGLLAGSGYAARPRFGLIREAIYGDLPGPRRAALHLRCAGYLVTTGGDPQAAAAHARAAARDGRAADAAVIARQTAAALLPADPSAAAGLITEIRRSISPNDPGRDGTVDDIVLLLRAEHDQAAAEAAAQALAHTDDPEARARLQALAARALIALDKPDEARSLLREATARPGPPGPEGPVRARLAAAGALATAAEPEEVARAAAARALAAARRAGDRPAEVLAVEALAETSRRHGRAAEALGQARVLRQLTGPGHPAHLAREVFALQQADRLSDAGLLLATAGPAAATVPSLIEARMWQQLALGQLAEAAKAALALAGRGRELASPPHRELGHWAAVVIAGLRGEPGAEPVRLTGPDLKAARERGAPWLWQPGVTRLLAQLGLAAADPGLADAAEALAALAAARNPGLAVTGGLACQVRGLVLGDTSLLGRAWALLRDSPRPLVRAGAAQDYGTALLAGPGPGSRAAGSRLLDEAWEMFGQLGASGPQQAVELALRRAGQPARAAAVAPEPAAGWDVLTAAERKVAELVSSGYTNRAAASQLGLSPNTIGTHVRSIFSKLHVQSRVQLANLRHEAQPPRRPVQSPARILRAVCAISALVKACPSMPHPPSGASEISTQVRSASEGSPAAAATISVISRTTPSFLSRSSTPTGVSTLIRT